MPFIGNNTYIIKLNEKINMQFILYLNILKYFLIWLFIIIFECIFFTNIIMNKIKKYFNIQFIKLYDLLNNFRYWYIKNILCLNLSSFLIYICIYILIFMSFKYIFLIICSYLVFNYYIKQQIKNGFRFILTNSYLSIDWIICIIGLLIYYIFEILRLIFITIFKIFFYILFRFKLFWIILILLFFGYDFNFIGFLFYKGLFSVPFSILSEKVQFFYEEIYLRVIYFLQDKYILKKLILKDSIANVKSMLYTYYCQYRWCVKTFDKVFPRKLSPDPINFTDEYYHGRRGFNWNIHKGHLLRKIQRFWHYFWITPRNFLKNWLFYYRVRFWTKPWNYIGLTDLYFIWWPVYCIFLLFFCKLDYNHLISLYLTWVWCYFVPNFIIPYVISFYYFFHSFYFWIKYNLFLFILCDYLTWKFWCLEEITKWYILKRDTLILYITWLELYIFLYKFFLIYTKFFFFKFWFILNFIYIDFLEYFNKCDIIHYPVYKFHAFYFNFFNTLHSWFYNYVDKIHQIFRISPYYIENLYNDDMIIVLLYEIRFVYGLSIVILQLNYKNKIIYLFYYILKCILVVYFLLKIGVVHFLYLIFMNYIFFH